MSKLRGSCQCGAVSFTLDQTPTDPTACHCVQCRKQSGHYFVSANVPKRAVIAFFGGMMFLAPYLLWARAQAGGDARVLLLGKARASR